jgi:hypothetical protein
MKTPKLTIVLTLLCLAILGAGCTTTKTEKFNSKFSNPKMDTAKLTSDVKVGDRVEGSASRNVLLFFIRWGDNKFAANAGADGPLGGLFSETAKVQQAAAYNALPSDNGEILIAPTFTITEHNYVIFKRYEAHAVGYRGTFENIRQVKNYNTDRTETIPMNHFLDALKKNGFKATSIHLKVNASTLIYGDDTLTTPVGTPQIGDVYFSTEAGETSYKVSYQDGNKETHTGWIPRAGVETVN